MLEGSDLHLSFVKAFRPLVERACLGDDHQIGAAKRERSHVLGIVTVVADRHADGAGLRAIHRRTGVAGRVIALLVEARIVGDVYHAGPAQKRAVGVDHRRTVESALAVAFVQVEDDDNAELASPAREGISRRARYRFASAPRGRASRTLWKKTLEGELGVDDQVGALARRILERGEPSGNIARLVGGGGLLHQTNLHDAILIRGV